MLLRDRAPKLLSTATVGRRGTGSLCRMRAVSSGPRPLRPACGEPPVLSGRAARVGALILVLLAFAGTWLGHTLEYLRVSGPVGLLRAMTGSVHLYMLPLGVVLLAVALASGTVWLRAVLSLAVRLQRLRDGLRRGRRARPVSLGAVVPEPGRVARAGSLWVLLGVTQIALYLVQENVESHVAGLRSPGLGAVLGTHWAAIPIHLLVAGVLAAAASRLVRYRHRLERAVAQHERVQARLWADRIALAPAVSKAPRVLTPHERWSSQRWQRPPPALIAA